jgi:hypothetical protein
MHVNKSGVPSNTAKPKTRPLEKLSALLDARMGNQFFAMTIFTFPCIRIARSRFFNLEGEREGGKKYLLFIKGEVASCKWV